MTNRPKRGTPYIDKSTGENVWLNRVVDDTTYFVCNDEKQGIDATFYKIKVKNLQPVHKQRSQINKQKPKSKMSVTQLANVLEKEQFKKSLNVWFANQMPYIPANCENCGHLLKATTSEKKRFVTAHILPKTKEGGFPAVATHPQNRMFLGMGLFSDCDCHTVYDHATAEERASMKCHSLAVERFKQFRHILTPKELIKASDYLKISQ